VEKLYLSAGQRQIRRVGRVCQDNVSLDQKPHESLRVGAGGIRSQIVLRHSNARSKRVLEIVNTDFDRLTTCHERRDAGATPEMSRHSQSEAMGFVDDCRQRIFRDVLGRLERGEPFCCPVPDGAPGVLRIANGLVLEESLNDLVVQQFIAFASEEWAREM
jgi:hypothetical protein